MKRKFIFIICLIQIALVPARSLAGQWEIQRILAGLELFPTLFSADKHLEDKLIDGQLRLTVVFEDKKARAEKLAKDLAENKTVRGFPISVRTAAIVDLLNPDKPIQSSGIFLSQEIIETRLQSLIKFGIDNHIIVFSPFDGDVEEGIAAGIFIRDRILPYINSETLRFSGIELKELFLRVAKQYERGR